MIYLTCIFCCVPQWSRNGTCCSLVPTGRSSVLTWLLFLRARRSRQQSFGFIRPSLWVRGQTGRCTSLSMRSNGTTDSGPYFIVNVLYKYVIIFICVLKSHFSLLFMCQVTLLHWEVKPKCVFDTESRSWCCWTCSHFTRDRRAGWPLTSPQPPTTGSFTPGATWASGCTWRQRRVGTVWRSVWKYIKVLNKRKIISQL